MQIGKITTSHSSMLTMIYFSVTTRRLVKIRLWHSSIAYT